MSHVSKHGKIEEIETPGQGGAFAYCPPDLDRQVERSDPNRSHRLRSREKHREMCRGNKKRKDARYEGNKRSAGCTAFLC